MAPATRGHFFRNVVSRAELVPIYAERSSAADLAEIIPRLVPARRAGPVSAQIGARSLFARIPNQLHGRALAAALPLDVAGVGRSHFGAFSPARRAPEVRLDVFLLHPTHFCRCRGRRIHETVANLTAQGVGDWGFGRPRCARMVFWGLRVSDPQNCRRFWGDRGGISGFPDF